MANWKHKLRHGKPLREAIDNEDYAEVIEQLKACFEELHKVVPDDYDDYDLERDLSDIDDLEYMFDEDYAESDDEGLVAEIDSKLNDLYDLCDAYNVWVEN